MYLQSQIQQHYKEQALRNKTNMKSSYKNPLLRRRSPYAPYGKAIGPTQKGRYQPRSKGYKKAGGKTLTKKVKELTKMVNADNATHTHRVSTTGTCLSAASTIGYLQLDGLTPSMIESSLANLRYYNPAVPGTLTTADGSTGTFQRKFGIHSFYSKLVVRNNYRVPAKVTLYVCRPKQDTNITPYAAFSQGMTDQGNPVINRTMLFLTDSDQFNELWSIEKSKSFELTPGHERVYSCSSPAFEYDPSLFDSHSLNYIKHARTRIFVIRVEGVLAHDTSVTTEQGKAPSQVDCSVETKLVIKYDAGTNLNDFSISDGYDSFTNAEEVTILHNTNQQKSLT